MLKPDVFGSSHDAKGLSHGMKPCNGPFVLECVMRASVKNGK